MSQIGSADRQHQQHRNGLANSKRPEFVRVPSFPIIGSIIPQLSGIPEIDPVTRSFDFWVAMRRKYGEFYSMGNPAGGNTDDPYRTSYVISDPREFMKIIRAGGKYPSGLLELLWVNRRWSRTRGLETTDGLFGRGEEWRRVRTFLHIDLLYPEAPRGYHLIIIKVSECASCGAQAAAESGGEGALNLYLNLYSFDMFSTMMMGEYTDMANILTPTEPENERFVDGAVQGLGAAIEMIFSIQNIYGQHNGI